MSEVKLFQLSLFEKFTFMSNKFFKPCKQFVININLKSRGERNRSAGYPGVASNEVCNGERCGL